MLPEAGRISFRRLTQDDFHNLCGILQDPQAMYAYGHAFSDEEVQDWLDRQLERYQEYGFGLWAVHLKETGAFIGQAGLTIQKVRDKQVLEIGYLFNRDYWHHGYATEAAQACKRYAFDKLGYSKVYSIIRDTNEASRKVALRNGMTLAGRAVKHYYGMDMPHEIYCAEEGARTLAGLNLLVVYSPEGDRVLMCKRRKDPYQGKYNFAGGKMEFGENGLDAAYRELWEETSITRDAVRLHHYCDFTYYDEGVYVETYVGRLLHPADVSGDENELCWMDFHHNFFDSAQFAGNGNIGHILELVEQDWEKLFGDRRPL